MIGHNTVTYFLKRRIKRLNSQFQDPGGILKDIMPDAMLMNCLTGLSDI